MSYGEQDEGEELGTEIAKINLNGHAVNQLDGGWWECHQPEPRREIGSILWLVRGPSITLLLAETIKTILKEEVQWIATRPQMGLLVDFEIYLLLQ